MSDRHFIFLGQTLTYELQIYKITAFKKRKSTNPVGKQFTQLQRQSAWDLRLNCNVVFTNWPSSANLRDALIVWQACCQSDQNQLDYVLIIAYICERYTPLTFTFLAPSVPNQTAKTQSPLEGWKIGRIGWVGFIWLAHFSAGGMDEATFRFRRVGGRTVGNAFRSMLFACSTYFALYYVLCSARSDIVCTVCI